MSLRLLDELIPDYDHEGEVFWLRMAAEAQEALLDISDHHPRVDRFRAVAREARKAAGLPPLLAAGS